MLLEVRGLEASHGDLLALRGLDFTLESGRTLAIVGANGAGKSTLLRCLCGAHAGRRGRVLLEGQPLEGLPAHRVAALGISLVPEGRRLFASLGVEENLLLGAQAGRAGHWNLPRVYDLFPRLAERRLVQSTRLSGGEQQMVAIARALMSNPRLLLCDEISLGLAPVVIQELYGHLAGIRASGTSLLLVEQDLGRALGASDQLLCLTEGRITLAGASATVTREQVAAAYFGAAGVSAWLDIIVQGVLLGGLYALFAAGLSLVFGVMRVVNIAHGDFIVAGAYVALAAGTALGGHPLAGALIAMLALGAAGYLLQRLVLQRAIGGGVLRAVLVTFGLSVILRNGLLLVASPDTRRIDAGAIETMGFPLGGGVRVGVFPLLTLALAVAVILALQWLTYRTAFGRSLRAVAEDADTAALMGVDSQRVFAIAMALALAIAALAGTCMGIRTTFDPAAGPERLLFGFEAVIVGGLGSLWGTLLGGICIGIAQGIGAHIDPDLQQLAGHIAFLAILALRPAGLLPRREDA